MIEVPFVGVVPARFTGTFIDVLLSCPQIIEKIIKKLFASPESATLMYRGSTMCDNVQESWCGDEKDGCFSLWISRGCARVCGSRAEGIAKPMITSKHWIQREKKQQTRKTINERKDKTLLLRLVVPHTRMCSFVTDLLINFTTQSVHQCSDRTYGPCR